MQFQVPQFIDVEDKIFGPFTFKQFVYVIGGGGLAFVMLRFIPSPLNWPFAMAAGGLGAAFAFVEIHKKPLIYFVEAAFWYLIRKKLYIWKKREKKVDTKNFKVALPSQTPQGATLDIPKLSHDKLDDLAWGLDINEHVAQTRLKEQLEKHKPLNETEEMNSFKF